MINRLMEMDYRANRKVWQILWNATLGNSDYNTRRCFGYSDNPFENDTFEYRPYSWDDDDNNNEYHFYHKPSGFKIQWYKYALRGAYCNMNITDNQFVDILYDCLNSLQIESNVKIIHTVDKWWLPKEERQYEFSEYE